MITDTNRKELFRWADQIPKALWEDLDKRPIKESAEAVGAILQDGTFRLPLVGTEYRVDPLTRRIIRTMEPYHRVGYQTGVVLLTTLSLSRGAPPSGRMTVPQELPGGRMFFTGAHAIATERLVETFSRNPDHVVERALRAGGRMTTGADLALQVPGLPYVPLYVLIWKGDRDLPSRAIVGIDDRAHFHLDLAGIFALINILIRRLCNNQ